MRSKLGGLIGAVLGMGLASAASAAISVPSGGFTENFTATPNKNDIWTTSIAGGSGDISDTTALDTAVNLLSITTLTPIAGDNGLRTLPTTSTNPPTGTNALWRHNTAGTFAQSFPTGNAASVLVANLNNASGADASGVSVSFQQLKLVDNPNNDGAITGWRLYVSTTGEPGSWAPVGNSSTVGANTVPISVAWPNGSTINIAFVDDNGTGDPDPAWGLDALNVIPTVPEPSGLALVGLAAASALRRRRR